MQEAIEEELAIMEEQSREGSVLNFDSLLKPVATLCRGTPPMVGAGASAREAVEELSKTRENCVLVVEQGALVGLLTARDVVKRFARFVVDDPGLPVRAVMTPNPETLRLEDSILALLSKIYAAGFSCVPIVDRGGFPLHVLTLRDVFEGLFSIFDREIRTTPPMPYYGEPYVWGG